MHFTRQIVDKKLKRKSTAIHSSVTAMVVMSKELPNLTSALATTAVAVTHSPVTVAVAAAMTMTAAVAAAVKVAVAAVAAVKVAANANTATTPRHRPANNDASSV
jgi:predicted alpha/beta hydrolase family esterase